MATTAEHEGQPDPGSTRGRRAVSRLHVRLPARALTLTDTRPAVLWDLSLRGAQIETDAQVRPGGEILLQWSRFEAFGEVVWRDGRRCGIRFHDMLTREELFATRDLDDCAHLPRDHDLARESARRWAEGLERH